MASRTANSSAANGVRKGLQFRDTRQGVFPNTIGAFSRLTLDAAMKAALTTAGAKLLVEIDAAGTRVFLADQRTGHLIGGPEDLAKLGGIRSFVSRERKESASIEVARETTQLAYKASLRTDLVGQGYKQMPLENSYGAAVRPLLMVIRHLDGNLEKLEANTNPQLRTAHRSILKGFFVKIKNCYFHNIVLHTKGENVKGRLAELLFDAGVPEYVHTRLTNQNLVLDRAQELCRVLFPSDASKGLALTIKEWRSAAFRDKLGMAILGASHLVTALVTNDEFLRTICKIDSSIGLDDETNPSAVRLLKSRVAVMPPMLDSRYVTEPGGKAKSGWKFPTPGMESISSAINALSTALMRVYSANLQSVDLVGDFYATIVPDTVSRAAVNPTNNFYVQWANAAEPTAAWADRIKGGSTGSARADVWRWLRTEMRLSEKGDGGKSLARAILLQENGSPQARLGNGIGNNAYHPLPAPTGNQAPADRPDVSGTNDLLRPLSATELPYWEEFRKATFPSKKKGKKKLAAQGSQLTRLTPEGVKVTQEIATLSTSLAERMRAWLRGFSDERLQVAAVRLINASFDELFVEEAEASDDGSDSDEESDDDE